MSRVLPLTLSSAVVPPEGAPTQFRISSEAGQIMLKGHLSAGSRGWTLRAMATMRRSTISVQVTATAGVADPPPDIEHHVYEATIQVRRPGRYHVRISHIYLLRRTGGQWLPAPVFEAGLEVS